MTSLIPTAFAFACLLGSAFALTDSDIAPSALIGKTLSFTIVNGGSPYATTGTWSGTFAASGNGFSVANITGDTVPISTTYTASASGGFTSVSLVKFIEGRDVATLTLYIQDGVGKYEVSIKDLFGVGLNGEFSIGSSVTKSPEIGVSKGDKNFVDGKDKVNFGYVQVGQLSAAKRFTIKNTGKLALKNLGFSVTGGERADFIVNAPKISEIAPGVSVSFRVFFKPKMLGSRQAVLHISSNDKDENPFDIKLVGTGAGIK